MEPAKGPVRIRLVLGKFRCTEVRKGDTGYTAKIALGGSTTMTAIIPYDYVDIREGDLLTFYTDVLTKGTADAPPLPPPIQ